MTTEALCAQCGEPKHARIHDVYPLTLVIGSHPFLTMPGTARIAALTSENERLTRQLKLATDGLARYGSHEAGCAAIRTFGGERLGLRCDCGWFDTLAAVKEAGNV